MAQGPPPGRLDWMSGGAGPVYAAYAERERHWAAAAAASLYSRFPQTVFLPPYHQVLLAEARRRIQIADHQFAVLLVQTACEFLTEQLVSHLLERRGVKDLDNWIARSLRWSFNIGNHVVMELCEILSNGEIKFPAGFRAHYEKHSRRRNDIAHAGHKVTKAEAEQSCDVAAELFKIVEPALGGRLLLTEPPAERKRKRGGRSR